MFAGVPTRLLAPQEEARSSRATSLSSWALAGSSPVPPTNFMGEATPHRLTESDGRWGRQASGIPGHLIARNVAEVCGITRWHREAQYTRRVGQGLTTCFGSRVTKVRVLSRRPFTFVNVTTLRVMPNGRAPAFQAVLCGFESRRPLHTCLMPKSTRRGTATPVQPGSSPGRHSKTPR